MTEADIQALVQELAPVIREYVEHKAGPKGGTMGLQEAFDAGFEAVKEYIDRSFADFEKRIKAIEDGGIRYCGVFQRAATYEKGSVITDGGCAWIALHKVEGVRPGEGSAWQLMVQKGRDVNR